MTVITSRTSGWIRVRLAPRPPRPTGLRTDLLLQPTGFEGR